MKKKGILIPMKDQKNQKTPFLSTLYLSWFFTGKSPMAPGTMGSLATLPFIYYLHNINITRLELSFLILVLYLFSTYLCQKIQKSYRLHDPQWIVIDEVLGMLVTWAFIMNISVSHLIVTFLSFRFFDIVKIWPASYFDQVSHGIGTMTDDLMSGLYAGSLTYFIFYLL